MGRPDGETSMALKSTIFKAALQIADIDHGYRRENRKLVPDFGWLVC